MANNAFYHMKVVGDRKSVDEFIRAMKRQEEYAEQGVGRVFDADVYEQEDGYAIIGGDCAWSVYTAMRNENNNNNIEKLSKRLNLAIEVYCEECGFEFQEHFLVKNGVVTIDQCVGWEEHWVDDYDTKEEAEAELDITFTEEEWANRASNDYRICRGGFESWDFEI